jgi:hypothetical protein
MRLGTAILALAAALGLGGCTPKKPQTVQAAPPPPKPAAAKPSEPLSIPQTSVQLPPPQPIPPDALPQPEPTVQPAPPPAPPRPNPRPPRTGTQTPRTEPVTPAGPPAPAPTAEAPRPPIAEALSAPEAKRLQDEAHARIQETRQLIGRLSARRLRQQESLHKRIESFLTQAEEAERRGDMRQASELAGRAAVLARELRP